MIKRVSMARPRFRVVSRDEVKISRSGDTAIFEYADEAMGGGLNLEVGPKLKNMTDDEILKLHNDVALSIQERRQEYHHVAVEIPVGKPQIEYSEQFNQWNMRGDVLRCYLEDAVDQETGESEPVVEVDGTLLTWREFGKMLTTFSGWGMRLVIVPDDELHETPDIQVMESREEKHGI
jgi:hypothetical protein